MGDYPFGTFLASEEDAYPNGAMKRKSKAICIFDGKLRTVYCGIPDTYFTIPAYCRIGKEYVKGYVHFGNWDGEWPDAVLFSRDGKGDLENDSTA